MKIPINPLFTHIIPINPCIFPHTVALHWHHTAKNLDGRISAWWAWPVIQGFGKGADREKKQLYYIYIYMVPSQNCVWNVPRCSGRMERRGFVTVLVPDLWSVMKYRLYTNNYIYNYIQKLYVTYIIYISRICTLKLLLICATSLLYTCSTQVCLAWLVLVH